MLLFEKQNLLNRIESCLDEIVHEVIKYDQEPHDAELVTLNTELVQLRAKVAKLSKDLEQDLENFQSKGI